MSRKLNVLNFAVCSMAAVLGGCASEGNPYAGSAEQQTVIGGQPPALQGVLGTLYAQGEWGAVLNYDRLSVAALEVGQPTLAKAALDKSLLRIQSVYANDPNAAKARSVWNAEGQKDFKGESYERAMAYYYRGVLYLADGDYDNASAAFKAAEYQDTVAESEQFASDFGMMTLLAGWAAQCNGDASAATELYQRAQTQQSGIAVPDVKASTLILFESGTSPVKLTRGKYNQALTFGPASFAGVSAVSVNGVALQVAGDIGFQAATRGGRQIDQILAGKASFKQHSQTASDVAGVTSSAMLQAAAFTNNADQFSALAGIGAAAGLFSIASGIVAANTTPKADNRYWDNLPNRIFVGFTEDAAIPASVLTVSGDDGSPRAPLLDARRGSCRTVLFRGEPAGQLPAVAPSNMTASEVSSIVHRNTARDAAFHDEVRAMLVGTVASK